jgi:hypothetical protein
MNNSGETTTFKFSGFTSPFKRLGTNNSNNTYDTADMVGTFSSIVGGEINQIQGGTHNFIGGGYNNILNSNTRNNYAIVGGADNTANSETGYGLMTGQYNINQGRWGFVAGRSNTIGPNNSQFCLGWGNTMTGDNSDTLGIFGSYNNTLDVSSTQAATIIGSSNSQLRTRGTYGQHNGSTIFGSNASYIKESSSNNNKYSGSRNGIILSNECGLYNSNSSNYLDHSLILSSSASTIYDSPNSQIIGGVGNTISGKTNSVMIGISGRTADASNTTYVENLQSFGGSFQVGSGNIISSTAKNVAVIGNNNNIEGAAGSAQMYIGNGFSSSAFGNYGLHIGNAHYASGSYNISVGDNTIEQNASYSICVGNSGGSQQHKQWGTDVYNLGVSNQLQGITGGFIFGKNHTISNGGWGGIFAGIGNSISSSGNYNTIIGGQNNSITGTTSGSTILSSNGRTATRNDATFVENLVVFNYAGLNFADDTAAAAGGVVLGQVYHTGGVLKIRIV